MKTKQTTHLVTKDFYSTLHATKPGESFVYATGLVMKDRFVKHDGRPNELGEVANAAWRKYELGIIYLTQRRVGQEGCEYIATKSMN